jgi:hypothetical protein
MAQSVSPAQKPDNHPHAQDKDRYGDRDGDTAPSPPPPTPVDSNVSPPSRGGDGS